MRANFLWISDHEKSQFRISIHKVTDIDIILLLISISIRFLN